MPKKDGGHQAVPSFLGLIRLLRHVSLLAKHTERRVLERR